MATGTKGTRLQFLTPAEDAVVRHVRGSAHMRQDCALCLADRQLAEVREGFNLAIAGARTDEDSFIEGFDLGMLVARP